MDELKKRLVLYWWGYTGNKLWKTGEMFHSQYERWMNGPLLEVNAEDVEKEVSII